MLMSVAPKFAKGIATAEEVQDVGTLQFSVGEKNSEMGLMMIGLQVPQVYTMASRVAEAFVHIKSKVTRVKALEEMLKSAQKLIAPPEFSDAMYEYECPGYGILLDFESKDPLIPLKKHSF